MTIRSLLLSSLLLLGLSACPPTDEPDPRPDAGTPDGGTEDEEEGTIAGQLTLAPLSEFGAGRGVLAIPDDPSSPGHVSLEGAAPRAPRLRGDASHPALRTLGRTPPRELFEKVRAQQAALTPVRRESGAIIPGELLVLRRDGTQTVEAAGQVHTLRLPDLEVRMEALPAPSPRVRHLRVRHPDGSAYTAEQTLALAERLKDHPDFLSVSPNHRVYAQAVPNDTHYGLQWHLPVMSLPEAWDLQTDAADVVVAVLDTGIVAHPDLQANVLPGADLISDPAQAGDGDGRDQDPTDEGGDMPSGGSSWHGTHVAGTIGADSNNGRGISGVAWRVGLVPVRVLGRDGGTVADIIAGVEWAVGRPIAGLQTNSNPADVLNLSLGGRMPPNSVFQAVVDQAVEEGAVFVVSAGNDNEDTAGKFPCNQQRVICVGASKLNTRRASYSNFGNEVTVMAPGGEVAEDANSDGYADGVLSTARGTDGAAAYLFYNGTSMAAPHVAGLVALMKQARRDAGLGGLTHAQALQMLTGTVIPGTQCSEGCGAGLINAYSAILAARGEQDPIGPGRLSVATTRVTLRDQQETELLVSNPGGDPITVVGSFSSPTSSLAVSIGDGNTFLLPAGASRTLSIRVTSTGLANGVYSGTLQLTPTSGSPVPVTVNVRIGPAPGDGRAAMLIFMFLDEDGEWDALGGGLVTRAFDYRYRGAVPPGEYVVVAAIDEDGNGEFLEEGERYGFYPTIDSPEFISVGPGEDVTGIDFTLSVTRELESEQNIIGGPCGSTCSEVCLNEVYCSQDCSGSRTCPSGSTCFIFNQSSGEARWCMADCPSPGGQSTCRTGQTCTASQGGAGYCIPN